jgi:hypothetical protein
LNVNPKEVMKLGSNKVTVSAGENVTTCVSVTTKDASAPINPTCFTTFLGAIAAIRANNKGIR